MRPEPGGEAGSFKSLQLLDESEAIHEDEC